jgi:predicted nucleotidyltransferase
MEAKLTELVTRLKTAAPDNLKVVVLYGSAVTGEFTSGHSDLNVLCITGRADSADLEALHLPVEWWMRQGNPAPIIFTLEELQKSADVFAIELLDIKQRHRVLFGEDFLSAIEVPLHLHRMQVERELRTNWVRLRESIVAAPLSNKVHVGLMLDSISTFCALFRHALVALGHAMPVTKREAVEGIASLTGADAGSFHAILDLREGKRKSRQIDVEATLHGYLEFVGIVTNEVDRRLGSG